MSTAFLAMNFQRGFGDAAPRGRTTMRKANCGTDRDDLSATNLNFACFETPFHHSLDLWLTGGHFCLPDPLPAAPSSAPSKRIPPAFHVAPFLPTQLDPEIPSLRVTQATHTSQRTDTRWTGKLLGHVVQPGACVVLPGVRVSIGESLSYSSLVSGLGLDASLSEVGRVCNH